MNLDLNTKQIGILEKALAEYYKNSFYDFVKDWFKEWRGVDFKPHYTTQYVCEHIQLALQGDIERLIISLPRGWGNSIIVSEAAPVFALLNNPRERIGCFSRALTEDAKMWHENSIRILNAQRTLRYYPENQYRLSTESKIILRTQAGGYRKVGSCLASSVGSDMTLAIVDDPADQEHFRSEAKRNRLQNFFTKSLLRAVRTTDYTETNEYIEQLTDKQQTEYELTKILERETRSQNTTHIKPRIILTMQRLHIEDPVAMFININKEMEVAGLPTSFKYISIPSYHTEKKEYVFPLSKQTYEAKEGEYTLAGTLTKEVIEKAKIEMMQEDFESQMQQNPIVGQNVLMQSSYFRYYNNEDLLNAKIFNIFITCDTANKTSNANDFSVMCCWGWNGKTLYLIDMIRGKWEIGGLANQFQSFYEKWRYGLNQGSYLSKIIIEDKASGTQLIQWAGTFLPKHLIKPQPRTSDKYSRYMIVGAFIEKGNVYLPSFDVKINGVRDIKDEITTPFLNEITAFSKNDTHKHDDICDCLFDACGEVFTKITNNESSSRLLF